MAGFFNGFFGGGFPGAGDDSSNSVMNSPQVDRKKKLTTPSCMKF
jgi:hypothetical protein